MQGSMEQMKTSGTTEPMNAEMDNLKSSFQQLKQDVVELFSHAFGLGREGAEYARDSAAESVENLKTRLHDLKERGADQVSAVGRKIEENPLPSALIAFGVGFVLAKLLSRR